MPRTRVTIRDVAAAAGVSRQTVSRVINDSDRVLAETRLRVEEEIEQLGYEPNAVARSMARGRTGILACISPNVTDYTFASIIEGAQAEARAQGYFLLSTSAPDRQTFDHLMDQLVRSGRTDGLMVIQPYIEDHSREVPAGCPTVFAGGGAHADQTVGDSVVLDDLTAAFQATGHLLELGHRRIAMITGPLGEVCVQNRILGFERALIADGVAFDPQLVVEGDWSAASGYALFNRLTGRAEASFTAVFAQNDLMAAGILRAAVEKGIGVPRQLSVIGIDDIPMAAYLNPPLTTMRQDFQAIGRQAARQLIHRVGQPEDTCRHERVRADLILRRSTAHPALL